MDNIVNLKQKAYYNGTKSLDGNTYKLTIWWNTTTAKWYLDLAGITNSIVINSIALLPGKDLLDRYGYRELNELWLVDNSGAKENPTFDGMGSRWQLVYRSPATDTVAISNFVPYVPES